MFAKLNKPSRLHPFVPFLLVLIFCLIKNVAASDAEFGEEIAVSASQKSQIKLVNLLSKLQGAEQRSLKINYLEDKALSLSIDKIMAGRQKQQWQPLAGVSNFGFSDSAYWLNIKIQNDRTERQVVYLRQSYPLIDHLSVWVLKHHQIVREITTGDREIFDSRPLNHQDFLIPLSLEANESATVILKYRSDGPVNIDLSLVDENSIIQTLSLEQLFFGAYYGGVIVLAIYNIFLFLAARQKSFVYYLWYLISYGTYMSVHNGLAFQYLWPENPWLANQSLLILLSLSIYWGLRFSADILQAERISPQLFRVNLWLQKATILFFILSFLLSYKNLIIPLSVVTLVVTGLILMMGIKSMLHGYRPAIFFMLAWSTLLVAVIIYMLKTFGLLPHNGFTQNAFQIASLIEMTLLSIALSHHFTELKKSSYTDALTGLFNRRHFDEQFKAEFDAAKSGDKNLSIMILDIDFFKKFNDQYGHDEGDKVIQFVASTLKKNVRKPLIPCRFGGEEFVVILPRTELEDALTLAERIRDNIEKQSAALRAVTVSIGVSSLAKTHCESRDGFFKSADIALYKAKQNGRNRVELMSDATA